MRLSTVLPVFAVALAGCLPYPLPHSSVDAPRFSGRVVDAVSHRPVVGAKVALGGLEDTATSSATDGSFLTRISRTQHLVGLYTYDDGLTLQFPAARTSDGTLVITQAGYRTAKVPARCGPYPEPFLSDAEVEILKLPDIRLRPDHR